MGRQHVVLLAFADTRGDLPELRDEIRRLQELFEQFQRDGRCTLIFRPNATLDQLYHDLQQYRDRIAIIHYGGHADSGRLLLEASLKGGPAHADGLATLLGQQRGLKLVFLNGCSTRPQVQRLLDAGVPVVIATAQPIVDRVARDFAVAFYGALTAGGNETTGDQSVEIKGGQSLAAAFVAAQGFVRAGHGGVSRDLLVTKEDPDDVRDALGFPWAIQVSKGAEQVQRWNLFDDDPLFGLPKLPADIGLPAEPFRQLESFDRKDARIFSGRGQAIRELYDLVTRPNTPGAAPLLLYYGQTGVGKTSVLKAGLLPRLEAQYRVRYLRRGEDLGLLGTLKDALAAGVADPFDLGRAWRAAERLSNDNSLIVVLDQAEEAYTRPLVAALSSDGVAAPNRAWIDPEVEVRVLVEAVHAAFDHTRADRPRGKLILSFRKEWLDEFEKACKAINLAFESVSLSPLDRAGVIEATRGPATEPDLEMKRAKFRLTIAPEEPPLPELLADNLLDTLADPKKNQASPVAPTLQILLTRMWAEACKRDRDHPTFDRALFAQMKSQGYQLGEVLDLQLETIRETDREAVDRGLVLDLLDWFTTPLGTAASHNRGEIHRRYPIQQAERLDAILKVCQDSFLLAETDVGSGLMASFRLTHDTLAPLIRDRFQGSMSQVPRARRTVANKAHEWANWPKDREDSRPLLEPHDLNAVLEAVEYLPAWTDQETRMVEASRRAEQRRSDEEAERQRQLHESMKRVEKAKAVSQEATELRLKEQRQANQRLRLAAYVLLGALAGALGFGAMFNSQRDVADATAKAEKMEAATARKQKDRADAEAEKARDQTRIATRRERIAHAQSLAARAEVVLDDSPRLGLLLASEAMLTTLRDGAPPVPSAEQVVRKALSFTWGHRISNAQRWEVTSPDRRWLILRTYGPDLQVLDANHPEQPPVVVPIKGGFLPAAFYVRLAIGNDGHRLLVFSGRIPAKSADPPPAKSADPPPAKRHVHHPPYETRPDSDTDRLPVHRYDLSDPSRPPVTREFPGTIRTLEISPDARWIITVDKDGALQQWDAADSARRPFSLSGKVEGFGNLVFSTNGRSMIVNDWRQRKHHVYDLNDPTKSPTRCDKDDRDFHLKTLDPERTRRVTVERYGVIRLWDVDHPDKVTAVVNVRERNVYAALACPDGRGLLTSDLGAGGGIRSWDPKQPSADPLTLHAMENDLQTAAVSLDGRRLVTIGRDRAPLTERPGQNTKTLFMWDVGDPAKPPLDLHPVERLIIASSIAADGRRLITIDDEGVVRTRDLDKPTASPTVLRKLEVEKTTRWFAAIAADGRRAITADQKGYVRQWDLNDPKQTSSVPFAGRYDRLTVLAYSPDGRWMAVGNPPWIVLWQLATTAKEPYHFLLEWREGVLNALAFSKDGNFIAAGGSDKTVVIWNLETLRKNSTPVPPDFRLRGHKGEIGSLAFSADGKRLASADGKTLRLWDLEPAEAVLLGELESAPGPMVFSTDNRRLILDCADGNVRIWTLNPRHLLDLAAKVVERNLSPDEWREYFPRQTYRPIFLTLPLPIFGYGDTDLKGNLSRAQWKEYYPDQTYRRFFPELPEGDDQGRR